MEPISSAFNERCEEVDEYLEFLDTLESQTKAGPPRIKGANKSISARQIQMIYSSLYIQIYNLVESTVTRCLEAVVTAAASSGDRNPRDLTHDLRREWVRVIARTHVDLNADKRLDHAFGLCNDLINENKLKPFSIEKGGGGNWDDDEIQAISKRIVLDLKVSPEIYEDIKKPIRNGLGPLKLVKKIRNQLAHGEISFSECAGNITVSELTQIKECAVKYLKEVVALYDQFIESASFLAPQKTD